MTAPSPEQRTEIYRQLVRAVAWEERLLRFGEEGRLFGFFHAGRGQEGTNVSAACALRPDDYLLYDHRGMSHVLAKGVPADKLFADFLGYEEGTTRGLGAGIVHIAWPELGVLGQSGTLGGSFPISAGAGLSTQLLNEDKVTLVIFGDGASNRGTFHESLNVAALWNLPVVYLCANNGYAVSVPTSASLSVPHVSDRAVAYGIPGQLVDGMDPDAVFTAVSDAVERARRGEGPTLLEATTYRYRGHYEGDPTSYRTDEEEQEWRARDPLITYPERLISEGVATQQEISDIRKSAEAEIDEAAARSLQGHFPEADRVYRHLYV